MAPLNIPQLLRSIDLQRADPEILVCCKAAQHWLRRNEIDKALDLAQTAARLAARAHNVNKRDIAAEARRRTSTGIALLYLAYLRHLSATPLEQRRALITGQSALAWLAHDDYHHALAELILAGIAWEEEQFETAALNYQNVLSRFDKMIAVQHRTNNPLLESQYQELKRSAQQALHRAPFSAFGEEALSMRLEDAKTSAILTTRKHLGKVRRIRAGLPELRHVVVLDAGDRPLEAGEHAFAMESAKRVERVEIAPVGPEVPSGLHYTSGTTGKPKGALHVHSSIVAQYITTKWVLDLTSDDVYWCTADPGWVTGTWYGIIGPWACGITQVVLDAGFSAQMWYSFIERHKVTVWYSAPTAIRLLMKEGLEPVGRHKLSCLWHLVSVGEPLNAEAVLWSEKAFGKPFHDSYWQTETGSLRREKRRQSLASAATTPSLPAFVPRQGGVLS